MKVRVEFYSGLRDVVSSSFLDLSVSSGTTVGDLVEQLCREHPSLRDFDKNMLFGIGLDFVGRDQLLRENDVVALMPPVQGG